MLAGVLPLVASSAARHMHGCDLAHTKESLHVDDAGSIDFNEFLAATIQQWQLDEANLRPAFDRLDRSHTGFINLADVTLTTGSMATEAESAVLVSYFDYNGDGQVSDAWGRKPWHGARRRGLEDDRFTRSGQASWASVQVGCTC